MQNATIAPMQKKKYGWGHVILAAVGTWGTVVAYDKCSPKLFATTAPVPTAPSTPAPTMETCCAKFGGTKRGAQRTYFVGDYIDAKCGVPVVQHSSMACESLPAAGTFKIYQAQPLQAGRGTEAQAHAQTKQLTAAEVQNLFTKQNGICTKKGPAGYKVAPIDCENNLVCRGTDGALTCTGCRKLANGCIDYEGSMAYNQLSNVVIETADK
jgi:hypothetical protein